MQGQHRQTDHYHGMPNGRNASYNRGYYKATGSDGTSSSKPKKSIRINEPPSSNSRYTRNHEIIEGNSSDSDTDIEDMRSGSYISDQMTEHSDNISTIPLKSVISSPSTVSPSVLSADNNIDTRSINASTTETSIAPSNVSHLNPVLNNRDSLPPPAVDRDSESIVTSTSSNVRLRRRSLETTSSTAGIAPASIMERISTQPTTNNSTYTNSINDRDVESQTSKYN